MIDSAPYLDSAALEADFIDAVVTEEGLAGYLDAEHLVPWDKALSVLPVKWRGKPEKVVVVLRLAGTIVEGKADTTADKIERMQKAGISVAERIEEIPALIRERLAEVA